MKTKLFSIAILIAFAFPLSSFTTFNKINSKESKRFTIVEAGEYLDPATNIVYRLFGDSSTGTLTGGDVFQGTGTVDHVIGTFDPTTHAARGRIYTSTGVVFFNTVLVFY